MFGNPFATPFIIPVVAIICWMIVKVARIKNGGDTGWHERPRNSHVPPMFDKMLEKAMQERDAEIQSLRERIEVLEKIITDNHGASKLADEIERLRS